MKRPLGDLQNDAFLSRKPAKRLRFTTVCAPSCMHLASIAAAPGQDRESDFQPDVLLQLRDTVAQKQQGATVTRRWVALLPELQMQQSVLPFRSPKILLAKQHGSVEAETVLITDPSDKLSPCPTSQVLRSIRTFCEIF